MFTKEQFIQSIQHETNICKHLYTKIPPGGLAYRPTPGQRSLLELMQYLTVIGSLTVQGLLRNDWSHVDEIIEKSKSQTADRFCEAMDRQCEEIKRLLQPVTEEDLLHKDTTTVINTSIKMGEGLVILALKFLTAYRMQMFLYLKGAGVTDINTANCWLGMDRPAS
ncbi:MAG: hypothetical protein ACE15F_16460 [bacterium]